MTSGVINLHKLLSLQCLPARRFCCSVSASVKGNVKRKEESFKTKLATGPGFQDFIKDAYASNKSNNIIQETDNRHAYLPEDTADGNSRKGSYSFWVQKCSQGKLIIRTIWIHFSQKFGSRLTYIYCMKQPNHFHEIRCIFLLSVFWNLWLSDERKWYWNCLVNSAKEWISTSQRTHWGNQSIRPIELNIEWEYWIYVPFCASFIFSKHSFELFYFRQM